MYFIYHPRIDDEQTPVAVALPGQVVKIKREIQNMELVEIQTPDGSLDLGMVHIDTLFRVPSKTRFNPQTGLPASTLIH